MPGPWQGAGRKRPPAPVGTATPAWCGGRPSTAWGGTKGQDYRADVLAGKELLRHRVKGRNLRALCLALKTWQESPQEMLARLSWGGSPEDLPRQVAAAQRLLEVGFREMGQWLRDQGNAEIAEFLGEMS